MEDCIIKEERFTKFLRMTLASTRQNAMYMLRMPCWILKGSRAEIISSQDYPGMTIREVQGNVLFPFIVQQQPHELAYVYLSQFDYTDKGVRVHDGGRQLALWVHHASVMTATLLYAPMYRSAGTWKAAHWRLLDEGDPDGDWFCNYLRFPQAAGLNNIRAN